MYNSRYFDENSFASYGPTEDLALVYSTSRYSFAELLGEGSFGRVYKAFDKIKNRGVAIKVYSERKRPFNYMNAEREMNICSYLAELEGAHKKYIACYYGAFKINTDCFLVHELLESSLDILLLNLFNRGILTEHLRTITRCILSGLNFLHEAGVIHYDIKPDNIAVMDWMTMECKIIDFGLCIFKTDSSTFNCEPKQVLSYQAPEIYFQRRISEKIDIFSAGCVFIELTSGVMLFNDQNEICRMAKMVKYFGLPPCTLVRSSMQASRFFDTRSCPISFKHFPGFPPVIPWSEHLNRLILLQNDNDERFFEFLYCCLAMDPEKRWSAKELLQHPWLLGPKKKSWCAIS